MLNCIWINLQLRKNKEAEKKNKKKKVPRSDDLTVPCLLYLSLIRFALSATKVNVKLKKPLVFCVKYKV